MVRWLNLFTSTIGNWLQIQFAYRWFFEELLSVRSLACKIWPSLLPTWYYGGGGGRLPCKHDFKQYIELFFVLFFVFISVGRSFHKLMVDGRKLSKWKIVRAGTGFLMNSKHNNYMFVFSWNLLFFFLFCHNIQITINT